jgi:hypothetical protein
MRDDDEKIAACKVEILDAVFQFFVFTHTRFRERAKNLLIRRMFSAFWWFGLNTKVLGLSVDRAME